jgi:hypothetical protein
LVRVWSDSNRGMNPTIRIGKSTNKLEIQRWQKANSTVPSRT